MHIRIVAHSLAEYPAQQLGRFKALIVLIYQDIIGMLLVTSEIVSGITFILDPASLETSRCN